MILAADLGGTQSRLLLAEQRGGTLQPLRQTTLPSHHYSSVEALLEDCSQKNLTAPASRPPARLPATVFS